MCRLIVDPPVHFSFTYGKTTASACPASRAASSRQIRHECRLGFMRCAAECINSYVVITREDSNRKLRHARRMPARRCFVFNTNRSRTRGKQKKTITARALRLLYCTSQEGRHPYSLLVLVAQVLDCFARHCPVAHGRVC